MAACRSTSLVDLAADREGLAERPRGTPGRCIGLLDDRPHGLDESAARRPRATSSFPSTSDLPVCLGVHPGGCSLSLATDEPSTDAERDVPDQRPDGGSSPTNSSAAERRGVKPGGGGAAPCRSRRVPGYAPRAVIRAGPARADRLQRSPAPQRRSGGARPARRDRGCAQVARLRPRVAALPIDLGVSHAASRAPARPRSRSCWRAATCRASCAPTSTTSRLGELRGRAVDEYRAWRDEYGQEARPPGGGESRIDALARYVARLRAPAGPSARACPLVVTHDIPIRFLRERHRRGRPARRARSRPIDERLAADGRRARRELRARRSDRDAPDGCLPAAA